MRAINLIPPDLRRGGGSGLAGRSGGAVYVIMAVLVALVAMGIAYGVALHRVANRKNDIVTATRQAANLEARAATLQPYVTVQTRRYQRTQLVGALTTKRFDWALAMRQIAKALPVDAFLTKMAGSLLPGGATGGGGLRSALPVPAIELSGCAKTQPRVAAAIDSLRQIPGVQVVALGQSVKSATTAGGGGNTPVACGADPPNFDVVVYYTDVTAPGAPQAASRILVAPNAAVTR